MQNLHSLLIEYVKCFGFYACEDGMCFGITRMYVHAGLQIATESEVKHFFNRLRYLGTHIPKNIARNTVLTRYDQRKNSDPLLEAFQITAFLQSLSIAQAPYRYSAYFNHKILPQNNLKASWIYCSDAINIQAGGLCSLLQFTVSFNHATSIFSWERWLSLLAQKSTADLALQLDDGTHAIAFRYASQKRCWFFFDINRTSRNTPQEKKLGWEKEKNSWHSSEKICKSYGANPPPIFSVLVLTTASRKTALRTLLYAAESKKILAKINKIRIKEAEQQNAAGFTRLMLSSKVGSSKEMKKLISLGACPKKRFNSDGNSISAYHCAANEGHFKLVFFFLKHTPKLCDEEWETCLALKRAIGQHNTPAVKIWIAHFEKKLCENLPNPLSSCISLAKTMPVGKISELLSPYEKRLHIKYYLLKIGLSSFLSTLLLGACVNVYFFPPVWVIAGSTSIGVIGTVSLYGTYRYLIRTTTQNSIDSAHQTTPIASIKKTPRFFNAISPSDENEPSLSYAHDKEMIVITMNEETTETPRL